MEKAEPRAGAIFTIPAPAPFLTTLADAILKGHLPRKGGPPPDPLDLPKTTILLPTRRAARALQNAFLSLSNGDALLLPRIAALGAPDEDEFLLSEPGAVELEGSAALDLPSAMSATEREIALTRLVTAWRAAAEGVEAVTPAQAHALSVELARLMDFVEAEEADLSGLANLVPDAFAAHWQLTLDFLAILTQHWPRHLEERGAMAPMARRNRLIRAWAARLRDSPRDAPVIAAGSTGSLPATAALLATIASQPNGAVVLPGLDLTLDDESWAVLPVHPEHPQHGMAQLLDRMGVTRADVSLLAPASTNLRAIAVSEALRPASTAEKWPAFAAAQRPGALERAFSDISLIAAPSPQDEAEVVALILREALETVGQTAALVTPDRALARRVSARLSRWGLAIDDSAGRAIVRTPPGAFMDIAIDVIAEGFAPEKLAALLKHPLTQLGLTRLQALDAARKLELAALRRPSPARGPDAIRTALRTARDPEKRRDLHRNARRFADGIGLDSADDLLDRLETAYRPLLALFEQDQMQPLKLFVGAHLAAAEAIAANENGSPADLWRGDAGEALAVHLADVLAANESGLSVRAGDYASLYRGLVSRLVVRPRAPAHPRLAIWGPLEARLLQPDVLVMGGLNEGVWPRVEDAGPWLSRPIRKVLGLPAPERRVGLSAHDFAQGVASSARIYLTRAEKAEGAPTVPSRWLLRLKALLDGAGAPRALDAKQPWLAWARARDEGPAPVRQKAPAPCPPIEARPKELSVSAVQKWMANPYEIFARHILKLDPMPALGELPDARVRGTVVHAVMHRFSREFPIELPPDVEAALMRHADDLFAEIESHPAARAYWLPQFQRFARWFAETEPARRENVTRILSELDGAIEIATPRGFRLNARADRVDQKSDGTVCIFDYKTGSLPAESTVEKLLAPQLPLEAAIAARGGFDGLEEIAASGLTYIRATGRGEGGEERRASKDDPAALAAKALAHLTELAAAFDNPATPYRALRRPHAHFQSGYRYDEYRHLARVFADDDEEEDSPS